MSRFRESLQSGRFLVTVTVAPPKGVHLEDFKKVMELLAGHVDGVNLPDGRSARIHLGPLAASLLAKEREMEPIFTLSCRDRNRIALSADILSAYAMGVHNILCVSGDYVTYGDAVDAKPVYDLDSVQALQMIQDLAQGTDIGGNPVEGAPQFCVGCVGNPQASPLEPHLLKLEKKLNAGAEFIQTLDLFELEKSAAFFEFLRGREVKVLAGVRLVTDREVDLWETGKLPGNPIPETLRNEIREIGDSQEIMNRAKNRVVNLIKELKSSGLCHGVHLTAEGHEELIPEMIQEAGI